MAIYYEYFDQVIMIAAPTNNKNRIKLLDALRGFAVLGIVLMNIYIGGHYWETLNIQELLQRPMSLDYITTMTAQILFEGKMRALFCILFGAGLMLFFNQKNGLGIKATKLHFLRMFYLILFGLFNAYILFYYYDILYYYGILGCLLFFIRNISWQLKLMLIVSVLLYGVLIDNMDYGEDRQSRLEYVRLIESKTEGKQLGPELEEKIVSWETDNTIRSWEDMEKETQAMRGSAREIAGIVYPRSYEKQITKFLKHFPDPMVLMILGMVLFQIGFLTGQWNTDTYRNILIAVVIIGIPLSTWDYFDFMYTDNFPEKRFQRLEERPFAFGFITYQLNRIVLAIGHLAFIIYAYQKGWFSNLFRRLEAVGQMALTNYLIQSMILVCIFFGFGFGLFDAIGYWELFLIPLGIAILQLWYSPIWLKHFRFGPFEWLWRSMTYGKWQPMKLKPHSTH